MSAENVVLITVDSLRADSVGFLSNGIDDTPRMDAIASDAQLVTDAMSPSSHTRASVPSLLTSQYPHNYFGNFFGDVDLPTIASYLSDAGYDTAAFHSNPLISRHFGYDEGFDEFYDGLRFVEPSRLPEGVTSVYSKLIRLLSRFPYEPAEAITRRARTWLSSAEEPFFLWVHYMDPHGPYALDRGRFGYLDKYRSERLWQKAVSSPEAVTPSERRRLERAYHEEIAHTDEYIGYLVDAIDQLGETTLALTGDHGEEFYEHGRYSHPAMLYNTTTNVPLLFDSPSIDDPLETDVPVSGLDIVPTILDSLDIDTRTDHAGESLLTLERQRLDRNRVIGETNRGDDAVLGVRTNEWKYIVTDEGHELYDITADPGEQNDLAGTEPAVETELGEFLTEHVEAHDVQGGDKLQTVADTMDTEVRDRLNDLGYL